MLHNSAAVCSLSSSSKYQTAQEKLTMSADRAVGLEQLALDDVVVAELARLWAVGASSEPLAVAIGRVAEAAAAAEAIMRPCNEALSISAATKRHRESAFANELTKAVERLAECSTADPSSAVVKVTVDVLRGTTDLLKSTDAACWKEHRANERLFIPVLNSTVLAVKSLCRAMVLQHEGSPYVETCSAELRTLLQTFSEVYSSAIAIDVLEDEPIASLCDAVGTTLVEELVLRRLCFHFAAGASTFSVQHPEHYFSFVVSAMKDNLLHVLLLPSTSISKDHRSGGRAAPGGALHQSLLISALCHCSRSITAHFCSLFLYPSTSAAPSPLPDQKFMHIVNSVLRFASQFGRDFLSKLPQLANDTPLCFCVLTPCLSQLFCTEGPLRSRWIHAEGKYIDTTVTSAVTLEFPRATIRSCDEWRTVWLLEALREKHKSSGSGSEQIIPLVAPAAARTARCIAAFLSRHRPLLSVAAAHSPLAADVSSTARSLLRATLVPVLRAWNELAEIECLKVHEMSTFNADVAHRGCLFISTAQYLAEHVRSWAELCEGAADLSSCSDSLQLCADRSLRHLCSSSMMEARAMLRWWSIGPSFD